MPPGQCDAARATEPYNLILAAVDGLPTRLQIPAIGAALVHILATLSEKQQAIEACNFIRTLLDVLANHDDEEDSLTQRTE